jgi:uncharacterized membrane protein
MLVKIALLAALALYSMLDYYQTLSLLECGHEEINPVVLWLIGPDENWLILLACKIGFLILLATTVILQHIKKKKEVKWIVRQKE